MTALPRSVANWCDRRTLIGLAWLIGFSVFFYSFDLPNNPPATRPLVWQVVPFPLLDVVWPLPDANAPPSGWRYLPQRLPAIGTTLAIFGAALGFGSLSLRRLRLTTDLTQLEQLYFAGGIGLSLWSLMTLGLGLIGLLHPAAFWMLIVIGIACLKPGPLSPVGERVRVRGSIDHGLSSLANASEDSGEGALTKHNAGKRSPPHPNPLPRSGGEGTGQKRASEGDESRTPVWAWLILAVCVSMVWAMLFGALTPQSDFDVLAYHLNGPKEWFQAGRIEFLPYNVYTSFPFLTEMLLLSGMVLLNDWNYGALAGQAVLMLFAPLTALGLYCAGRRWFSAAAGWLAALVWLTTPWAYRISIIAYAEGGLAFYLFASFLAAGHAVRPATSRPQWFLLCGFLAGSAMACKYTGLTSVIAPIGLGMTIMLLRIKTPVKTIATHLLAFALGIMIAVGPWLAKNLYETGNPVYPLGYSVFGGRDVDPALNAKWEKGHAPAKYASLGDGISDFLLRFQDIVADNDWHSSLLYGLAPLSLFLVRRRKHAVDPSLGATDTALGIRASVENHTVTQSRNRGTPSSNSEANGLVLWAWLFIAWLFLTWFFLTHHIDRFWVPMIPVVALLAGAGAATFHTVFGKWLGGAVIAAAVVFNLTICSIPRISGFNAGLMNLSRAQQIAESSLTPEIGWLNEELSAGRLPADFKLLCEGEAATFHARFPVAYHSVFDRCLLEEWCAAGPGPKFPLKSAEEIRDVLKRHGITHVFVNWRWILTYRDPGNYGFTDFVSPNRLRQLQGLGVLGPPLKLPEPLGISPLTDDRRKQLEREGWTTDLVISRGGESAFLGGQIFPVK